MSFAHATEFVLPLPFPVLLIKIFAVDILSIIYFKNNLRVDYKKRLTCFYGHYGYYAYKTLLAPGHTMTRCYRSRSFSN